MKRIYIAALVCLVGSLVLVSCGGGEKTTVKQETPQTNAVVKNNYDKMNDTAFANVMNVLRESLESEKKNENSMTKMQTAKAYMLVIKFIKTDKDKVLKSGMTDEDIKFLISDAKSKAGSRLDDIATSPESPKEAKDEAKAKKSELDAL